jgi:hypothetical protein
MKRILLIVFALVIALVAWGRGVSRVKAHSLPRPNPTSYVFPFPIAKVRESAFEAFSMENQIAKPIFNHSSPTFPLTWTLTAESADNAVFGESVFRDPANDQDIYLHSFHSPFVIYPVYFGRQGGLPFIATFHLHLAGSDSNTIVSVTASNAEVINGTRLGFGPCGPGQANNYVKVQPTTVEEYSILRYLGVCLGITNMPGVVVPK